MCVQVLWQLACPARSERTRTRPRKNRDTDGLPPPLNQRSILWRAREAVLSSTEQTQPQPVSVRSPGRAFYSSLARWIWTRYHPVKRVDDSVLLFWADCTCRPVKGFNDSSCGFWFVAPESAERRMTRRSEDRVWTGCTTPFKKTFTEQGSGTSLQRSFLAITSY